MKIFSVIVALVLLTSCETYGSGNMEYASDNRPSYIGADKAAGRLGTLRGYVIRRSGSPLCNNPIVEQREIRCSIVEVTGPTYEIGAAGTLEGFVVRDSQNRAICSNPNVAPGLDQIFIDC